MTGGLASGGFVLPDAEPRALGLDPERLDRLGARLTASVASGARHAAEIAVARHGRLALSLRAGVPPDPSGEPPLWLLYSNTKVLVAAALWRLVEDGRLSFADPVSRHVRGFERHGKQTLTVFELLTHQGGFPLATVPPQAWADHALLHEIVCDFVPQWPPGSRVHYHPGSAWWVVAVLIETVTGEDYRAVVRDRVLRPLGLECEIVLGATAGEGARIVSMHDRDEDGRFLVRSQEDTASFRSAGIPGGGGFATARGMAAFYQMLAAGGVLGATRLLSPALVEYVTRDFTGDRVDEFAGIAMHRGLGPHRRGHAPTAPGLGTLAHPDCFGHGGVGSSFCWADPRSGVSFAFLSDTRLDDALHLEQLDLLGNIVHAAIMN